MNQQNPITNNNFIYLTCKYESNNFEKTSYFKLLSVYEMLKNSIQSDDVIIFCPILLQESIYNSHNDDFFNTINTYINYAKSKTTEVCIVVLNETDGWESDVELLELVNMTKSTESMKLTIFREI